jgi:hypothetical protein
LRREDVRGGGVVSGGGGGGFDGDDDARLLIVSNPEAAMSRIELRLRFADKALE